MCELSGADGEGQRCATGDDDDDGANIKLLYERLHLSSY